MKSLILLLLLSPAFRTQDNGSRTPIRGATIETLVELVNQKTGVAFSYNEASNLANVRVHLLLHEQELPKTKDAWMEFLLDQMKSSGHGAIERKVGSRTYYEVVNWSAGPYDGRSHSLPRYTRVEDLPKLDLLCELDLKLTGIRPQEALGFISTDGRRYVSSVFAGQGDTLTIRDSASNLRRIAERIRAHVRQAAELNKGVELELTIVSLKGEGKPRPELLPESVRKAFDTLSSRYSFRECSVAGQGRILATPTKEERPDPRRPAPRRTKEKTQLVVMIGKDRWRLEFELTNGADPVRLSSIALGKWYAVERTDVTGTGIRTTVFDRWDMDTRLTASGLSLRGGKYAVFGSWTAEDGSTRVALIRAMERK